MITTIHEVDADRDLLALHRRRPHRYPFLLESAAGGTAQGRFDLLFCLPGDSLRLDADGTLHGPGAAAAGGDFLTALDAWWRSEAQERSGTWPPFRGGWFVYLGYALAGQIEPALRPRTDPRWPTAVATRVPAAVVRDRRERRLAIVVEAGQEELIGPIAADLAAAASEHPDPAADLVTTMREDPPQRFVAAVRRAQEHIGAGDVFQANLSRAWQGTLANGVGDAAVYSRLRAANPGPFAGIARFGDGAIISSSPERLVAVRDDRVQTRPIAGTRPRADSADGDAAMTRELIAHPKERAEHVMLIDLERNDLGRICRPGSVIVDELMALESYAHVHHIVSNVSGTLAEDVTPGEVIRAVFPGGTITGCPKVRCMQIIDALEAAPRGPYTGSVGYLNRDGDCDFNILIRTIVRSGRSVSLRAGAGIVADSRAQHEVEETRAKARGMLLALGAGP